MAQQLARDEAGNVWDTSVNPPRLVQAASASQARGRIYTDPTQAREQARKDAAETRANEDQGIARDRLDLSRGDNARADAKARIENAQGLRKEYAALPEVKEYKVASQMAAGALNTSDTPQGDLSLVYSFAKAMDPGSVVRDQEANMITNAQPWFASAVQNIKKQFGMDGAGSFTPESRKQLRQEILRSLASRKTLYDTRRAEMADYAKANGMDPYDVVGRDDTQSYAPFLRRYGEKQGDPGGIISGIIGGEPLGETGSGEGNGANRQHLTAAAGGANEQSIPIPPEMQAAHNQYIAQHWGKIDPQDYAAFRVNLDRKYGFGTNPEGYAAQAPRLNEFAASGRSPEGLYIPAVQRELSGFDKFRNDVLSNPVGAGTAAGLNAAGLGLPSLLAPEQSQALREEYPLSSIGGDIVGSMAGAGITGGALKAIGSRMGEGAVARALANPLAADAAYGATYGATQADDPLYGAVTGATGGVIGNRIGAAAGRSLPGITGMGRAIRQADEAVPTSEALKEQASLLYDAAEASGDLIGGDETLALADRVSGILSQEGRMSPKGNLTEVQSKTKEAYKLIQDYAGEPMSPTQVQTVRSVIADGLNSQEGAEQRIARLLLNDFDDWTDGVAPELASGLRDARGVASRYIQGDKIAQARELADVRAGQFSNAGQGNALRTDFRQLDRNIVKGNERFAPDVEAAIADVARGNPVGNALRFVGRFAPTGNMAAVPTMAAMAGGGAAAGPLGIAGGLGLGGLAYGARQLGQGITERGAQVAENLAYGGPEYGEVLNALLDQASARGGHMVAGPGAEVARILLEYGAN